MTAAADRGTWRLIAARDFWVRLRERSFLISTLLNVGVISVLVLARASGGFERCPSFDLGDRRGNRRGRGGRRGRILARGEG